MLSVWCEHIISIKNDNGGSVHPEVKLDIHVFSKPAGVVIPQCFGIAKCLHKAGETGN